MAFTDQQARQLKAKLDAQHVKTRKANGMTLSYIEGWHAIAEANRIFGFDGWDRRTLFTNCIWTGTCERDSPRGLYGKGAHLRACRRCPDRAGRVRHRRRQGRPLPGRRMRSRSNPPRPMPPSGRSPPSAMCLGLPFTIASKRAFATMPNLRLHSPEPIAKGPWVVHSAAGAIKGSFDKPIDFVQALRKAMTEARDIERLFEIWEQNVATVRELNASREKLGLEPGFAPSLVAHLKSCAVALVKPRYSERRAARRCGCATSEPAHRGAA